MPLWFRAYNEAIDDRKLKYIARAVGLPKIAALGAWWVLLGLANNSTHRGELVVDDTTALKRDDLILELGDGIRDPLLAERLFDQFVKRELVLLDEETGVYYVAQFNRRNFVSDDSTSRVQRYRDKKKREKTIDGNGDVTPDETLQEHTDTESDTESDTENQRTESQQQTTDNDPAAVVALGLNALNVHEPTATRLALKYGREGMLDQLAAWAPEWIVHFEAQDNARNPVGMAIDQLKEMRAPPVEEPAWKALAGDHLCPTCFARPCMCEQFEEVTA